MRTPMSQKDLAFAKLSVLDYILPQVAKLSRTLQTEQLDLSMISSLINAILHTLHGSLLPSANRVFELLDDPEQLEEATGIITLADITTFQEQQQSHLLHALRGTFLHIFLLQMLSYQQ